MKGFFLVFFVIIVVLFSTTLAAQTLEQDSIVGMELLIKANQERNPKIAAATAEKALPYFEKHKLWPLYFRVKSYIISLSYRTTNIEEGVEKALALTTEIEQKLGKETLSYANSFSLLAGLNESLGNISKTIEYRKKTLAIAEQVLGNKDIKLLPYIQALGDAYIANKEPNQGLIYMEKAELVALQTYDKEAPQMFRLYGALGLVCSQLGKFEKGYYYSELQFRIAEEKFPKKSYQELRAYDIWTKYFAYKALASEKEEIEIQKKNWEDVIYWQKKAIPIYEAYLGAENPYVSGLWGNLGSFYINSLLQTETETKALEKRTLARQCINKALSISEKVYNGLHPDISVVNAQMASTYTKGISLGDRDYNKIFYYQQKSIKALLPNWTIVADSIHAFPDFTNPANLDCLQNNQLGTALSGKVQSYIDYVKHTSEVKYIRLGLSHAQAGELFIKEKQRTITRKEDEQSLLDFLNLFYNAQTIFYTKLYEKTKDKKYTKLAFEYAEKSKSIVLLRSLKSAGNNEFSLLPKEMKAKEIEFKKTIAIYQNNLLIAIKNKDSLKIVALKDSLYTATKNYDDFGAILQNEYPEYFNIKYSSEVIGVKDIQYGLLSDSTLLIEIHKTDEASLDIFTISAKGINQYRIEDERIAEFEKNIKNELYPFKNYGGLKDSPEKAFNAYANSAYRIYKDILELDKILVDSKIKELIIIPDGVYSYIPFELLIKNKPLADSEDFKELDYLIKDYTISYAYSANVLLENKKRKKTNNNYNILAFGASYDKRNITANRAKSVKIIRDKLIALPGVLEEVSFLEEQFLGDFYLGDAANERNFKQINFENYGIVHFAMHGILDAENAMLSNLAFTENNDSIEDNLVYAYELMNMSIGANLVVLSACETGVGEIQNGEGVLSLARAFAYAGVPSTLMTLWEVNDFSTSFIMKAFYQNLSKGMNKAAALRQAKLSYLDRAEGVATQPVLWGPYILVGDTSPVVIQRKGLSFMQYLMAGLGLFVVGMVVVLYSKRKKILAAA